MDYTRRACCDGIYIILMTTIARIAHTKGFDMFPTTDTLVEMFPHTDGILDMFPHTADIHKGVSGHVDSMWIFHRATENG